MKFVTPKELMEKDKESVLILDIRKSNKFEEWSIKNSQNLDIYDEIWQGSFETVKQKLNQLPKDKEIVTVCNAGVTSQKASMMLESLGYKTSVLEKGMAGWNTLHILADISNENDLIIKQLIRIGKGCLSYIVGSKITKECIIIDPSQFIEEYQGIAENFELSIKGVIETHIHADHLSGAKLLTDIAKTKYYVSSDDIKARVDFEDLKNKEEIKIGNISIEIIKTPGHTNGSVCLLVDKKILLTGDTLFLEGVGRPDLGRNKTELEIGAKSLYNSLEIIKSLDNEIIILPAHFTDYTTLPICKKLSDLIKNNKPLKINSEHQFIDYITSSLPITPSNYEQIKDINLKCIQVPRQIGEQLEFGPNRCASK